MLNLLLIPLLLLAHLLPPAVSLSFNYSDMANSADQNMLVRQGNVSFNAKGVDLTWFNDDPMQSAGRVFYKDQLFLWDSATQEAASFNCSFSFSIIPSSDIMPADGLAFFLLNPSRIELPEGSQGSWLGLFNTTLDNTSNAGVVAVEFDTFKNDFDPSDNHIGIDINSISSSDYANLSFPLPSTIYSVFSWVDYSSSKSLLEVYATNVSSTKPGLPLLSYVINLAQFLPQHVLIGFSAATGTAAENHRLLSWSFISTSIGNSSSSNGTSIGENSIEKKGPNVGLIAGPISAGIIVSVIMLLLCRLHIQRRRKRQKSDWRVPSGTHLSGLPSPSHAGLGPYKFNYRDLREATNYFSDDFLLGEGGFGAVYKGVLPDDGSEVAVKCISQKSAQGEKEFLAEVSIISRIRHKNLVQLKGWCRDKSNLLLVYEYLPNGSLDHYLFRKESSSILCWRQRFNVLCGLGSALQYLHEECERVIVHRDIKASNVMLDANYNAKLGDFGLARQLGEGVEGHTTLAMGTVGYMAPEAYGTGRATTDSDVFSYGMVLLEVVCGRRPVDVSLPRKFEGRLLDWVWDLHSQSKLREAADARLVEGAFDEEQLVRTLTVGLACAHPDPKLRPSIHLALQALQGRVPLPIVPTLKPVAYYGPPPTTSLFTTGSSISFSSSAPETDSSEKKLLGN